MSDSISIMLGGDLSYAGEVPKEASLWGKGLQSLIEESDFLALNLEGPLTAEEVQRPKIGAHLKGRSGLASFLRQNHVKFVSLANNHIFDYEENGVRETMRLCNENGISFAGIAEEPWCKTSPVKYADVKGRRIGFYCLAEHEFNYKDDFSLSTVLLEPARNVLEIQRSRKECDALIVFSHIGPEHTAYPSPRMVSLFHCFAEAGASAIVNAHAHHVMGMENYGGVPIFYGLGNLLFSMKSQMPGWKEGMLAHLELQEYGSFVGKPVFTAFDAEKVQVSMDENPQRAVEFKQISDILSNPVELDALWHDFCCSQRRHILKECAKGGIAMLPCFLASKITGRHRKVKASSYFAKGGRMLRGMFQCENHADVLARIFRDLSNGDF